MAWIRMEQHSYPEVAGGSRWQGAAGLVSRSTSRGPLTRHLGQWPSARFSGPPLVESDTPRPAVPNAARDLPDVPRQIHVTIRLPRMAIPNARFQRIMWFGM